jgi:hypothetical protein
VGLLGKLLLTAAVIAGVMMYLRYRSQQSSLPVRQEPRVVNPRGEPRNTGSTVRWLATLVVVVVILTSGVWLYRYWEERHEVLYVRVVDAGTGHAQAYRAYRSDIDDREFVTLDGTTVRLAETERLETSTVPPARN